MTANELADEVMEHYKAEAPRGFNVNWMEEVAIMLRQQQAEIEALKKELALQKLSDIGQEIEDRDSAIYATGYWNGIAKGKPRELTEEEIDEVWVETCSDFKLIENGKTKGIINIYDVSRAIIKKASEK
jgi:hypothetical protein